MKALIEIGGDWQCVTATIYIHPKYTDKSRPNFIDCKAVVADGFGYVVKVDSECNNFIFKLANSPEYQNRSFIFVEIKNPFKVFDQSKIKSNVPVEVVRTHDIMGWVVYGVVLSIHKIKSLFKKGS